jgi:MFS family permease
MLFLGSLFMVITGNGTIPLLPVYAARLGAPPWLVGYYLSITFLFLAAGALSAGAIFRRVGSGKAVLAACGAVGILLNLLLSRITAVWQLVTLTAIFWFCGGLFVTLTGILAGLDAGKHERGRVFGILAMSNGLASLIGGLTLGNIADRWGYAAMFLVCAFSTFLCMLASLMVQDRAPANAPRDPAGAAPRRGALGQAFYMLFAASIVSGVAAAASMLSRPLAMNNLGFNAAAIASTGAVIGGVGIPIPFLMGWLSDHIGRKWLIAAGYLAQVAALVVLSQAVALWHFWIAMAVGALGGSYLGSAFVADLVRKEHLSAALSRFGAAAWIGPVVGFVAAGYAIQRVGPSATMLIGACIGLIAVILVATIRRPTAQAAPASQ